MMESVTEAQSCIVTEDGLADSTNDTRPNGMRDSLYFNKYPNFSRAILTTSWLGALTIGNLSFHS
jgi:hypothetical protein